MNPEFREKNNISASKTQTMEESIIKEERGFVKIFRKNKIIDGLPYYFEISAYGENHPVWEVVFRLDDSFAVADKGFDFMNRVMDELAEFIREVNYQKELPNILLSGSAEIVTHEDIETFKELIMNAVAQKKDSLKEFNYKDSINDITFKQGVVFDNKMHHDRGVPMETFFATNFEVANIVKDFDYCNALCNYFGVDFKPKSKLSTSKDKSLQRAKLFEWALASRLPDYEVQRDRADVYLTKK